MRQFFAAACAFAAPRCAGVCMLALALALLAGCASVLPEVPRTPSQALDDPRQTLLARSFAGPLASGPRRSGVHLLVSGQEAFAARAVLAESAQRTLDLQYYIVAQDATASQLLYGALRAAGRGVRVRLLIDDMNTGLRDPDLAILALHPNVEVRLFNPFSLRGLSSLARLFEFLGSSERLNRRMHNKLWIADNAAVVMGGRNLGDAYFDGASDAAFVDLDVLAVGQVVREVSASFDRFWNSAWAVPIGAFVRTPVSLAERDAAVAAMAAQAETFRQGAYAQSVRATELRRQIRSGTLPMVSVDARALSDVPGDAAADVPDKTEALFPALRGIVERAQREVLMVSPYFVPSDPSLGLLCELTARGVRVRVLTNSLASTDVPVVHAGYARYRARLLACGVALFELRPSSDRSTRAPQGLSSGASLHAKAVVVDRQLALLGSMNLDPRSRRLNTEVALQIDSATFGQQLGMVFDEATVPGPVFQVGLEVPGDPASALYWDGLEDGRPVRYTVEPLASPWRRIFTPFIGAFMPEELL